MLSLIFYVIVGVIILVMVFLLLKTKKQSTNIILERDENVLVATGNSIDKFEGNTFLEETEETRASPFGANLIVLRIIAFPGKPYMGYELHQALFDMEMRFGEMNLFHRYAKAGSDRILFSVAAATSTGEFSLENMGSFSCHGLLLFMKLIPRTKLMDNFDLMLDTARQLAEELGGEIVDDIMQPINAKVIQRLRERICQVDISNQYASDLLDNLDNN